MPEQENQNLSEVVFSWTCSEYEKYRKNIWWYVLSLIVLGLLIWWSFSDGRWGGGRNYLFVIFLVLFYLIVLIYEIREPAKVEFAITQDGVKFGEKFYFYKEIHDFFIIYQEPGVKSLYLDFKNPLRGRLAVPLDGQDAIAVREHLLQFVKEDLDWEAEPITDRLRRWLRF